MSKLSISLLGTPSITLDQIPLDAQTYKATALLAYLAINQQPHTRLELATLLWSELDKDKALAALRTTVWKVKRSGITQWLTISRNHISLNIDPDIQIDVLRFQELLSQTQTHGHNPTKTCAACIPPLTEAISLYRGDFMKGFSLRDAGEFDNWQSLTSEIFRQDVLQSLEKLVQAYRALGDLEHAIRFARLWANYDSYNEEIHRQLMNMYVSSGQRSEALIHYRKLVKRLHRDLLDPQPETTQLYHQIQAQKTIPLTSLRKFDKPILLVADFGNMPDTWLNDRDQMTRIMQRYVPIVKESTRQYGGQIIKQTGDVLVVLFDGGLPVHCALAIQNRWMRTTWGKNVFPSIRMALYATERKQPRLEDYSNDVLRARCLLNAGWEAQILLTTRVLNSVDLPANSGVVDLGIHLLKDLSEPLRIYHLNHPDLSAQEYPPLQTLSQYRHNLPVYPTTFIDRQKEQQDLKELLTDDHYRLLTLVGPGGVGKTRLALQVAAQLVDTFQDGIFFISVAVPKTPDLIPAILAETFNFYFYELKEPVELIIDYLREKSILLVIDNFEHMVEGAVFLLKLLENAPGLKIIVTSRERLNLRGEKIYEVQGMSVPPIGASETADQYGSVQLFIHNASRILPGFQPNLQDLEAITRICNIVDGIPLAIELATAWVRTLSCQEIALEIEHNLGFLSSSLRDLPARHRSLRAVFEHSWNLLSEEERRTLRKLAVFRGGFTADAALVIAKATPLIIAGFVNRSLLRHLPQGRYEMIEILRHFAEQKLRENPEDEFATRNLHCEYFSDFLNHKFESLFDSNQIYAINDIRTDIENIRIAWYYALQTNNWALLEKLLYGLSAYNEILGHNLEEFEMFQAALYKINTDLSPGLERIRANLQCRTAWIAIWLGDHIAGLQGLQAALQTFTILGLKHEAAIAQYLLAKANTRLNHTELALQQIEESLEILNDERYRDKRRFLSLKANILGVYGSALIKLSRLSEGKQMLLESLALHQQLGTRFGLIQVIEALGRAQDRIGDYTGAQQLRLQALALAKEIGNKHSIAILLNNIADSYLNMKDYEKASYYQKLSIELSREIGNRWLTAIGLNNLAYLTIVHHKGYEEGMKLYQESRKLFSDIHDHQGFIYTTHDMSIAATRAGQYDQSLSYSIEALRKSIQVNSSELQLYVICGLATIYESMGKPESACELCNLILVHPQANTQTKTRAKELFGKITKYLPNSQVQAITERCQTTSLEEVITRILSQNN